MTKLRLVVIIAITFIFAYGCGYKFGHYESYLAGHVDGYFTCKAEGKKP